MRMPTFLLVGLLGGVGLAGGAGASDDCVRGYSPGYYLVCLFDDHRYQQGGCHATGCWTYEQTNNPLAHWTTSSAGLYSAGGASQSHGRYEVCRYGGGCEASEGATTYASGGAGSGASWTSFEANQAEGRSAYPSSSTSLVAQSYGTPVRAYVWFDQYEYVGSEPAHAKRWSRLDAAASSPLAGASLRIDQTRTASGCSTTVAASGIVSVPLGPCTVGPAGTELPMLPQLYATCIGAPTGPACPARFPDWPDGSGLPFL